MYILNYIIWKGLQSEAPPPHYTLHTNLSKVAYHPKYFLGRMHYDNILIHSDQFDMYEGHTGYTIHVVI